MSEWKECRLGDVCRYVCSGGTPKSSVSSYYEGGTIPWLNTKEIHGDQIFHTERFITEEGLNNSSAKWIKANCVVVAMYGATAGQVAVVKIPVTTNQACCNLEVDDNKADYRFVFYALRQSYKSLSGLANGGAQQNLNAQIIKDYKISFSPLPTQRKIAAVLGALDDKIEMNRKMNATLEQMAQTLFKSWFVDFEPFGVERKSVDGRQIPVEFELVQIGQLNPTLETGKRPKGGASTSGVPSVGAESVKHLGDFDYSATKFVPEEFAAKMVRGKINGYEVLLYKDGGKPGTFMPHFSMFGEEFPYADFYINEHVFKLDAGSRERNVFLLFNLQTDINVHWFESCGAKAAVPGINQSNVFETWVFNPDQPKAKEFSAIVLPMVTKILKNCKQSRTLAQLRDTLLPKLMSGELDVDQVRID